MIAKSVVPRERARRDVADAVDYNADTAGQNIAVAFIDAVEAAYRHIVRQPASGSPRYAHELHLPGLCCWRLRRFPYMLLYIEQDDHIDVWRVLHGHRDIPAWMQEPEEGGEPSP